MSQSRWPCFFQMGRIERIRTPPFNQIEGPHPHPFFIGFDMRNP